MTWDLSFFTIRNEAEVTDDATVIGGGRDRLQTPGLELAQFTGFHIAVMRRKAQRQTRDWGVDGASKLSNSAGAVHG